MFVMSLREMTIGAKKLRFDLSHYVIVLIVPRTHSISIYIFNQRIAEDIYVSYYFKIYKYCEILRNGLTKTD